MAEQQNPFSIKSKARFSLGAIALTLTLVLLNIAVYFYQIIFASPLILVKVILFCLERIFISFH